MSFQNSLFYQFRTTGGMADFGYNFEIGRYRTAGIFEICPVLIL